MNKNTKHVVFYLLIMSSSQVRRSLRSIEWKLSVAVRQKFTKVFLPIAVPDATLWPQEGVLCSHFHFCQQNSQFCAQFLGTVSNFVFNPRDGIKRKYNYLQRWALPTWIRKISMSSDTSWNQREQQLTKFDSHLHNFHAVWSRFFSKQLSKNIYDFTQL